MMRVQILVLCVVAFFLAAPAGAHPPPRFKNRTAFESYVAGYLHLRSVSCEKLNERVADCVGSDHHRYVVACARPGGKSCRIVRYG